MFFLIPLIIFLFLGAIISVSVVVAVNDKKKAEAATTPTTTPDTTSTTPTTTPDTTSTTPTTTPDTTSTIIDPQYIQQDGTYSDSNDQNVYTCTETKSPGYCIVGSVDQIKTICSADPQCLGYLAKSTGDYFQAVGKAPNTDLNGYSYWQIRRS